MLKQLHIKNFKAWQDSGPIRLAPITVFFGANSAGKTSIPQLLLLLKQTAESPDRQRVLHLGDSRTAVDLGTYADVVHGHMTEHPMGFGLKWKLPGSKEIVDPLTKNKYRGDVLRLDVTIDSDSTQQPTVQQMAYTLGDPSNDGLVAEMVRKNGPGSNKYDLLAEGYKPVRQPGRAWPLPPPVRCYGFPDEATAYYQNTGWLADLVLALEQKLRSLYYVGPLREYAKRIYLWSGEVPQHVGIKGERVIEAILASGGRKFNFKSKGRWEGLEELVARWLKQMGLIHAFEIKPLSEGRKEYEVLVQAHPQATMVRLTDVGFGVSQVLPVLAECFYVPAGSTVIFEQPEIHLHPRVQADLADLFIEAVHAREGGKPREVQVLIESHSEHFLRRLQARIAEEKIDSKDVALYFVHADGPSARIEELSVDEYGNISNWPDNFFGDEMKDLVARAEAQARKMTGATL